ncbi:hypothetical protein QBC39DRAFT_342295 [Podospora conica]|nr:hypothetical protein QBC39DRAFT_342295 [Schizothecium conicum]
MSTTSTQSSAAEPIPRVQLDSTMDPDNSGLPQRLDDAGQLRELARTWKPSKTVGSANGPLVDYVIVPGLGSTPGAQEAPAWIKDVAEGADRVFYFDYTPHNLFAGSCTQNSIRRHAMGLLRGLDILKVDDQPVPRQSPPKPDVYLRVQQRIIMFVSWDTGGTIVKDVLRDSCLSMLTMEQVFVGYPHRSSTAKDLEHRLRLFATKFHGGLDETDLRVGSCRIGYFCPVASGIPLELPPCN